MQHVKGIALIAIVLIIGVGMTPVSALIPSHVEPGQSPSVAFDFPAQLSMFTSLGVLSHAVLANITQSQFANASVNFENYSKLADSFNRLGITQEKETAVVAAIQASSADLNLLAANASAYKALSGQEQPLLQTDPFGNQSQSNALKMRTIAGNIGALNADIGTQLKVISKFAAQNGLSTNEFAIAANNSLAYAAQVQTGLDNVTAHALYNTNTTLYEHPAQLTYGETLYVNGTVRANQTGVPNEAVDIAIDGTPVTQVSTNASGSYETAYTVTDLPSGPHSVVAEFSSASSLFNPSNSSLRTVDVGMSNVSNGLRVMKGGLLRNRITFFGTLQTETGTPVSNTGVLLYINNETYKVQTNANGSYVVSYSLGLPQYLASVFVPSTLHVYALFEPQGLPLEDAQSNVLTVASGDFAPYIIVSLLILSAFLTLFVYSWRQRSASVQVAHVPRPLAEEPIVGSKEDVLVADRPSKAPAAIEKMRAAMDRAEGLAKDGKSSFAIRAVYGATIRTLAAARQVDIDRAMTAREIFVRIVTVVPESRAALHALTYSYEMASYSERPISAQHVSRALTAVGSLKELIEAGGEIS